MPDLAAAAVERALTTHPVADPGSDPGSSGAAVETAVTGGAVRVRVTPGCLKFPKIVVEDRK